MNEKIGVFGGTFDPIHVGHLIIAEWVREACSLEKILFIPAGRPPHKLNQSVTEADHRLTMTRLALKDDPYFECNDLEIRRSGPSFTVDTLRTLKESIPNHARLFWIIGSDSLLEMPSWHKPEEIFKMADVVVYPRAGFSVKKAEPRFLKQILFVDAPLIGISSTEIRQRVREGKSIRYLVPSVVEAYIHHSGLYRAESDTHEKSTT